MRLLLDTRVWLWSISDPDRLSADVTGLVKDEANDVLLSAASVWEICDKAAAGTLTLTGTPQAQLPGYMRRSGVQPLPITAEHVLRAASLPPHHSDPIDRMLVAQAQAEQLTIVSADEWVAAYEVESIKA